MAKHHQKRLQSEDSRKHFVNARKFVKELKHDRFVSVVAQFDMPRSTELLKKDQQKGITKMLLHNKICTNFINDSNGCAIKEMGDAVLAIFPNIPTACKCALKTIANLKKQRDGICTKVTITVGRVESIMTRKEHDLYGLPMNFCNRMARHVNDDSILIEESRIGDVRPLLSKMEGIKICEADDYKLDDFGKQKLREITVV